MLKRFATSNVRVIRSFFPNFRAKKARLPRTQTLGPKVTLTKITHDFTRVKSCEVM